VSIGDEMKGVLRQTRFEMLDEGRGKSASLRPCEQNGRDKPERTH